MGYAIVYIVLTLTSIASIVYGAEVEIVVGLTHNVNGIKLLQEAFWNISTPGHERYLNYLSADEVTSLLKASSLHQHHARQWLEMELNARRISLSNTQDMFTAFVDESMLASNVVAPSPRAGSDAAAAVNFVLRRNSDSSELKKQELSHRRHSFTMLRGDFSADPDSQRKAFGIPANTVATNTSNIQMVWGPGTFGYRSDDLQRFYDKFCILGCDVDKVSFDTENRGVPSGDNFFEGTLDTQLISSMGRGVRTLVSNTNTSTSTEEGHGFGAALLDFATSMTTRTRNMPLVISMSLGSLGFYACDTACDHVTKSHSEISYASCEAYLQTQRQVCMFLSSSQQQRINEAFMALGARGITLLAASGDGGSHYSFSQYDSSNPIGKALDEVSCKFNYPTFPSSSPYVLSVGGSSWDLNDGGSISDPVGWPGSGGGFSWVYPAERYASNAQSEYFSRANTHGIPVSSAFNKAGRGYPDLAAPATDVPLCFSHRCHSVGGTSASTPSVAGMISLLNDHRLNNGLPPLGFVVPRIYEVAQRYPGEAFQDITVGNTKGSCDSGFPSEVGWDPQTGWGQPKWAGLLKYVGSDEAF